MSAAAPDPWRRRRSQAERLADAESARIDAETAQREAQLERDRAERERHRAEALRVAAETTAHKALQERDEALARAAELEASLTQAVELTPAEPAPTVATAPPPPSPAPAEPAPSPEPEPEPEPEPPAVPEGPDVTFAAPPKGAAVTILLSLAALCAAGTAVYLAYLDRLASLPGLVTAVVTVALAVSINRTGRSTDSIAIRRGVVVIEGRHGSGRFDLTNPDTLVEMVGRPGGSGWKVVFLRKSRPSVTVDRSMVDPVAFVDALRRWRPTL
jgi:hypothetical protein